MKKTIINHFRKNKKDLIKLFCEETILVKSKDNQAFVEIDIYYKRISWFSDDSNRWFGFSLKEILNLYTEKEFLEYLSFSSLELEEIQLLKKYFYDNK